MTARERPIMFSAPMVRAILAGRKTQTRRVVRFLPPRPCPYGVPGDRLWVRETWCADGLDDGSAPLYHFRADGDHDPEATWRPSIFMPRTACRIVLDVTGVRIERVQDISEADAKAEGPELLPDPMQDTPRRWRDSYRTLWDSINGKRAPWDSNPWVWVVEFKVAP